MRVAVVALALTTATLSATAYAQVAPPPTLLFTIDESGHGTVLIDGTSSFPLASVLAADPTLGGLPSALTYDPEVFAPLGIPGDVFLQEDPNVLSDVIRFYFPVGTDDPLIVFYSDDADGADALADTGLPTAFSTNTVTLAEDGQEGNNGAFYTPTANQPGFLPGFATTYHFISDATGVPEPSTWAMMLAGFGTIGVAMRRRRRKLPSSRRQEWSKADS